MEFRTLWLRFTAFVSDFLPESSVQLLFPLASFILFVGASTPRLPPGHVFYSSEFQSGGRSVGDLWFDISSPLLVLRYYAALYLASFAFFADVCKPIWRAALGSSARFSSSRLCGGCYGSRTASDQSSDQSLVRGSPCPAIERFSSF